MTYGVCDNFTYRANWQFINILPGKAINAGPQIYMLKHKSICRFHLFINAAGEFLTGYKNIAGYSLKYRALNRRIRIFLQSAIQQLIAVSRIIFSFFLENHLK